MFQVEKRDGTIAEFQMKKITDAIGKAFGAKDMQFSDDMLQMLALRVTADFQSKIKDGKISVEAIQDSVENGFKMLYGHLTDKNNPMKHPGDSELFLFPTRDGRPTSFVMDPKTPYMECSVGIHNILKILHIDYVRRLNYLDHPDANKWGVRFMVMMTF